jgi:hypothetical protein
MVRRTTSCRRLYPFDAHLGQIERVDKRIDHANRIILVNEIIQALGQERPLPTIRLLNEAPHQFPQESPENHNSSATFSHSQGQKATFTDRGRVPAWPSKADIPNLSVQP